MSFFSWFKKEAPIAESWIVARLHAFVNDVQIVEADLQSAADWIFSHMSTIEGDLATIVSIATAAGVAANPVVATAITVTQSALTALNAYETAHNAGAGTLNSVVNAYQALKSAQSNLNTVAAALVKPVVSGITPATGA